MIEAWIRRGLRIPEGVSVAGEGGEEVAGLTCHQADWFLMGQTAVRVLLRALSAGDDPHPEHHLCPHALRRGSTTTPPVPA